MLGVLGESFAAFACGTLDGKRGIVMQRMKGNVGFGAGFVWFVTCVLVALGVTASPSFGQMGFGMGGTDAMTMAIGRESAARYCDLLGFDQAQRDTAMMVHQDYLDQFKTANDVLMDAMRKLQEDAGRTRDWEAMMKPMGQIAMGFMDKMEKLEASFFEDLRALAIEPEQEAAFVRVERARRREQVSSTADMSVLSGATLDLHDIARTVEVSGNAAVAEALHAYETEIDPINKRAIDRVTAFSRQQLKQMQEGWEWNEDSMTRMQEAMKEMRELGTQGKAINARYARQVMQALPAETQRKWDREVKQRTWPAVYRPSKAERQIEAAGKLEDLTPAQRESLSAIDETYRRESAPINERWAKAIDDQQSSDEQSFWGWGGDTSASDAVAQERTALDDRFVERVRSMLTPEQVERMPKVGDSGFDADAVLRQFGGG